MNRASLITTSLNYSASPGRPGGRTTEVDANPIGAITAGFTNPCTRRGCSSEDGDSRFGGSDIWRVNGSLQPPTAP